MVARVQVGVVGADVVILVVLKRVKGQRIRPGLLHMRKISLLTTGSWGSCRSSSAQGSATASLASSQLS